MSQDSFSLTFVLFFPLNFLHILFALLQVIFHFIEGQVEWGFEQLALVEGVPAYGRRMGARWSLRSPSVQAIL